MSTMNYQNMPPELNDLSRIVIGLAIKVHSALGPGLLESVYKECLYYEIRKAGYTAVREYPLPLVYETVKMDIGYRADIIVENSIIIETKAVEALTGVHKAQVITYLKLSGCSIGLLINFNVVSLKDGIKRMVM